MAGVTRPDYVERYEDMSPLGRLRVFQQDDGDMIICAIADDGASESVEFCNSGGKSPRTLAALRALMNAMEEDNKDPMCIGRRGKYGRGV